MKDTTITYLHLLDAFCQGDRAHLNGHLHTDNPHLDPHLSRAWDAGFRGLPKTFLKELQ